MPALPNPPHRRPARPDRRFLIILHAVETKGAAYNPVALAEETGLPADAIRRFAAQFVVDRRMVELEMIEPEDAIRMGSEALAASIRIAQKGHSNTRDTTPARVLRGDQLRGMLRVGAVASAGTIPARFDPLASRQSGDTRPHAAPNAPMPEQKGLPHA